MNSISSRDKAIATENNILAQAFQSATEQTVSIIDVISEGPIQGLVNGQASIFLNDDRITSVSQTAVPSASPYTLTITSGSAVATINQALPIDNSLSGTRYFTVEGVFSAASISISNSGNFNSSSLLNITSPTSFFQSYMVGDNYTAAGTKARLVAAGYPTITGAITIVNSGTSAVFNTNMAYAVRDIEYTIYIDYPLPITSFSGTTVQLPEVAWFSGVFNLRVEGAQEASEYVDVSDTAKYNDVTTQFRVGTLHQPILSQHNGLGNTSISNSSFSTSVLEQSIANGGDGAALELVATSSAGFALTASQAVEVDEIRAVITYPSGLYSTSGNTGTTYPSYAFYSYDLQFKRAGVWGDVISIETNRRHTGNGTTKNAFSVEEVFNLEPFKPFDDFKLIINRKTRHDGEAITSDGSDGGSKYTQTASAALATVTSVIKEPLSYPYTALAAVTFSTKEFQSVPSRTYHARGMKVQVPSNYITREESSDGVASYNRNVTTGIVESTYQDWDGDFRTELVYTNNPAWVFRDIIVNNRYGLGAWIDAADIDIYSLYRIARYCDELVPDGKGGYEPRFTANLYLTKATDSYKVLKDIATIFRGILYWMDAKLTPVIDEPKSPIYTFTQGNVISGTFSYESTGSKTRSNQVVVSWTNPDADYKLEALLVEDKENIIETGRLLSQDAVAIGATSEGQALRFGRWKLWTAKNQKEIVSFQTSINAAFIGPGDVINIQDSNRYNIQYSGRIPVTGILNKSRIPLDREVVLNSGSTYELSIILVGSSTILTQDSAVIDSVTYYAGDLLPGDYTESEASNLLDDSGQSVLTSWKEYSRVETKEVSTAAGTVYVLDVSEEFSQVPARSAIWALKEINVDGTVNAASLKQYKIISIAEEGKHLYSIVAVEHYNEKFDEVDRDFIASVPDTIYTPPKATDTVPAPRNVSVIKTGETAARSRTVTIKWDRPATNSIDANYAFISGYEISHPFFGYPNPIVIGSDISSYTFPDIFVGTYTIGVRTINSRGNKSDLRKVKFSVGDAPDIEVSRGKGVPIGGTTNMSSFVTSDGYYKFETKDYIVAPLASPFTQFKNVSSDTATYIQDVTDVPAVNYSALADDFTRELSAHYILFDFSDTADPLKLVKYNNTDAIGIPYWYDTGTGNSSADSSFTTKTGTVTVTGMDVLGSGTAFLSEYSEGDLIKFSSTKAGIVVFISDNTHMTIDRELLGVSSSTHSRQNLRIDPTLDCAIAQIKNDTVAGFISTTYLVIDPALQTGTKVADIRSAPATINFDNFGTLATTYSNLVLTVYAPGFTDPEFKITGTGFDNAEISQVEETAFSSGVSKVYTKTLDKVITFVPGTLDFTVTVREKSDPTNIAKQATDNIKIQLVKSAGQKTYYQETAPVSGMVEGDFWIRDSDNRYHRYNGTSWVEIADAEFDALIVDIAAAQATADGKIQTFYTATAPTVIDDDVGTGDLWFDTDDGNTSYRWNGSTWIEVKDDQIAQAIDDAADAQATADGKVTTFIGTTAPTAEGVGDLWLDTDDNNRVYRWNGSAWVERMPVPTLAEVTPLITASGTTVISGVGNNFIIEANSSHTVFKHYLASLSTVGTYSGTLRTGLFVGSNGIAMGYNRKSDGVWIDSIVLDGTSGSALYSGNINTKGSVYAAGNTSDGTNNWSMWAYSTTHGGMRVDGTTVGLIATASVGSGIIGVSTNSSNGVYGSSTTGVGVRGEGQYGGFFNGTVRGITVYGQADLESTSIFGTLDVSSTATTGSLITGAISSGTITSSGAAIITGAISGASLVTTTGSGISLSMPNGYIDRPYSTVGRLTVYDQTTGVAIATYRYSFHI